MKLWASVSLLSLALLAGAQTTSEKLQQLQQELRQQKQLNDQQVQHLEKLRRSLQNLTAQQQATLQRLDALAAEVQILENDLAMITARVTLAERQVADISSQRAYTEARFTSLQADVRSILNALYREHSGQYLQLLSQSSSLSDLLIRLNYANMSGEHNVQVIQNLRETADSLKVQQEQQAQQTRDLKNLQGQRSDKLASLRQRRAQQEKLLAQLRSTAQGQRTVALRTQAQQVLTTKSIDELVGKVMQERVRIEAERKRRLEEERRRREEEARRIRAEQERARLEALRLAKLRAEQEKRAREARLARERAAAAAAAAQQRQRQAALLREQQLLRERQARVQQAEQTATIQLAPLSASSGPLGMPLQGGVVAAPYGSAGAQWTVLTGQDGAEATAALDGNVIAATYYASLGWIVLVDHGSDLVTGYFGLQNVRVAVGNRVAQGTPLGQVGGSHIFGPGRMAFQVRQAGQPVPPSFE